LRAALHAGAAAQKLGRSRAGEFRHGGAGVEGAEAVGEEPGGKRAVAAAEGRRGAGQDQALEAIGEAVGELERRHAADRMAQHESGVMAQRVEVVGQPAGEVGKAVGSRNGVPP
jgi:hypothetical protein